MFKFISSGIEYNKMAECLNGINMMVLKLKSQILDSFFDNDFDDQIFVLAYMIRVGVYDRMEKYNWPMDTNILVPMINTRPILLATALSQTVSQVGFLSVKLEISDELEEILERGPLFYEVDEAIPPSIKKTI